MGLNHSPKVVTNGLSLYLDANNTKSYPGSGTTWFDISGNNRNFTWVSTPTFTSGNQKYFNTLNNRCTGPASNSFGINDTSGYTIVVIMLQNTLTAASAFKFYKDGSSAASRAIFSHLTWSDGNIYFDQGGCCGGDTRTFVSAGGDTTTNWGMYSLTRQASGSTRKIYKNANLLATNTAAAANISLNSVAVDLGSSDEYGGNASVWNARLGGFMVYNRELTDSEVQQNFNALRGRFGI